MSIIKIVEVYKKFNFIDEYNKVEIFAKVSTDKITIRPPKYCRGNGKDFQFINSDKNKAKAIINLMLEACKL